MKQYKSKLGEINTYEGWKRWAMSVYEETERGIPIDWWARVQRVLKLEEIENDVV